MNSEQPTPSSGALSSTSAAFLSAFQNATSAGDASAIGDLFADVFLNADPNGTAAVPRAALLAALPHREKLFAQAGLGQATLVSACEQALDEHFILLTTHWSAPTLEHNEDGGPVALHSTFVLRVHGAVAQVVMYLNHQDITALLTARTTTK